jgi:hypothetical protein
MKRSTITRTAAVGATCALVGTAAGIAGSSASTPRKPDGQIRHSTATIKPGPGAMIGRPGRFAIAVGGAAGPPVHSETVVPNEKGGFDTVTMDRGRFSSLSGEQLTIAEGTKTATYKTVTLTIPSGAKVYRNGETAQLSDIKSGDTVTVVHSPKGTVVNVNDAEHEPKQNHVFHKAGGRDGPPPPGPPGAAYKIAPGEGPPPPGPPGGPGGGSSTSEGSEGGSSSR